MTENKRLLNKDNTILQNQNMYYDNGEEQAKKHLEQFKQNLIENFNEAEPREEFIDECKDTEKQENIKLENVDSLFAHKRFIYKDYGYDGWMVNDTQNELNDELYEDIHPEKVVELLNRYYEKKEKLNEENANLCEKIFDLECENEGLKHHFSELQGQNEILNKENAMLKNTIARNEAYIKRIQHKGKWRK